MNAPDFETFSFTSGTIEDQDNEVRIKTVHPYKELLQSILVLSEL